MFCSLFVVGRFYFHVFQEGAEIALTVFLACNMHCSFQQVGRGGVLHMRKYAIFQLHAGCRDIAGYPAIFKASGVCGAGFEGIEVRFPVVVLGTWQLSFCN